MAGVEVSNFPAFSLFPVKQKLSHYKKLDKKKKKLKKQICLPQQFLEDKNIVFKLSQLSSFSFL